MKQTSSAAQDLETLVGEWFTVPDIMDVMDVDLREVRKLLDSRAIVAVPVGERQINKVPASFFLDGKPVDALKGTIHVLADAGYNDEQAIVWLHTFDETLPGTPMDSLRAGRKAEIRRRASALAW